MKYEFNISQLHILSILVFDASIEPEELNTQLANDQLEFSIERRTFESVERSKWLFWHRTRYNGRTSKLRLTGVVNSEIQNPTNKIYGNDFINQISSINSQNLIELTTTFGRVLQVQPSNNFKAELEDLNDSEFGKGVSYGKHGYTESEWQKLLTEEGINAM